MIPPTNRNGPLSGAALCCTNSIVGGAPSQGVRNLVRLAPGFAFAARRSGQPLLTTDHRTPSKARIDHVAHSFALKPERTTSARPGVFQ